MKLSIASSALLIGGLLAASTETASAVVYCRYSESPAGCVARPVVVVVPTADVRRSPPSIDVHGNGVILRQDLFDRNSPNNVRSDWPSPPGLPGAGH
jgi:hypothetical protein